MVFLGLGPNCCGHGFPPGSAPLFFPLILLLNAPATYFEVAVTVAGAPPRFPSLPEFQDLPSCNTPALPSLFFVPERRTGHFRLRGRCKVLPRVRFFSQAAGKSSSVSCRPWLIGVYSLRLILLKAPRFILGEILLASQFSPLALLSFPNDSRPELKVNVDRRLVLRPGVVFGSLFLVLLPHFRLLSRKERFPFFFHLDMSFFVQGRE